MKKYFLLVALIVAIFTHTLLAQDYNQIRNELKDESISLSQDTTKLVTNEALNNFYARKAAYYLSGSSDLSLFGNYAVLNTSENRLSLGHNFLIKRKKSKKEPSINRIRNVFTISLQADIKDGFSTLYSAEKLSNNIGIGVKYTLLGNGYIKFDNTIQSTTDMALSEEKNKQKLQMNEQIKIIYGQLLYNIEIDSAKFFHSIKYIEDVSIKNELIEKYNDRAQSKYRRQYNDALSKKLDNGKFYDYSFFHWLSIEGYVPFTSTKYYITTESDTLLNYLQEQKFRLFDANLSYTQLWQSDNWGNLFINLKAKSYFNNSVKTNTMKKVSLTEYIDYGGSDTLVLNKLGEREANVGNFTSFWTSSVIGELIYFFPKFDSKTKFLKVFTHMGLSVKVEKIFGDYNPFNIQFGVPMNLMGKKRDAPVNFELQFRFNDFSGDILPNKNRKEKLTIGFSIGLPFGSLPN